MAKHPGSHNTHKKRPRRRGVQNVDLTPLTHEEISQLVTGQQTVQPVDQPTRLPKTQTQTTPPPPLPGQIRPPSIQEQIRDGTAFTGSQATENMRQRRILRQSGQPLPSLNPNAKTILSATEQGAGIASQGIRQGIRSVARGEPVFAQPDVVQTRLRRTPGALEAAQEVLRARLERERAQRLAEGSGGALQVGRQGGLVPTRRSLERAQANLANPSTVPPLSAEQQTKLDTQRTAATEARETATTQRGLRRGAILGKRAGESATLSDVLLQRSLERRDANIEAGGSIGRLRSERRQESLQDRLVTVQLAQAQAQSLRSQARLGSLRNPGLEARTSIAEALIEAGDMTRAQAEAFVGGGGQLGPAAMEALLQLQAQQGTGLTFDVQSQPGGTLAFTTQSGRVIEVDAATQAIFTEVNPLVNEYLQAAKDIGIFAGPGSRGALRDQEAIGKSLLREMRKIPNGPMRKQVLRELIRQIKTATQVIWGFATVVPGGERLRDQLIAQLQTLKNETEKPRRPAAKSAAAPSESK